VILSTIGGLLLVISGLLFLLVLLRGHRSRMVELPEFRFAQPVHASGRLPAALNSYAIWLALMIGLSLVNYGYPIAQLVALKQTSVPAIPVGGTP
jgi:cytochrome c oxidase subunit 1